MGLLAVFAARPGKSCQNTLLGKWLMHNGFNIRQIAAIRADGDFCCQSGYVKLGKAWQSRSERQSGTVIMQDMTLLQGNPAMNRLLLVDDDVELAEMLRDYLVQEGFAVTLAHDGEAGAQEALSGQYALIVLDVMMPRASGVEVLGRVRSQISTPIIMLTAKGDDVDRIIGLEMGADDYVPKPCTPRELVARIRAVLRRVNSTPTESADNLLQIGELTLWPGKRTAQWRNAPLELTSTEFNLLLQLARNAGRVVSKRELSEQALGRSLTRFDRSIDVHLSSIRHKLGRRPDGQSWIETIRGIGYQFIRE